MTELQCIALTKSGPRCRNKAAKASFCCLQHQDNFRPADDAFNDEWFTYDYLDATFTADIPDEWRILVTVKGEPGELEATCEPGEDQRKLRFTALPQGLYSVVASVDGEPLSTTPTEARIEHFVEWSESVQFMRSDFGSTQKPTFRLGPPIKKNLKVESAMHAGQASIPDTPAPENGIVKTLKALVMPGQPQAKRCFVDVYRRSGGKFILRRSLPVTIDHSKSVVQSVPIEPLVMSKGDYIGLRPEGGGLRLQWLDGAGTQVWIVDRKSGSTVSHFQIVSCGWNVTVEKLTADPIGRFALEVAAKKFAVEREKLQGALDSATAANRKLRKDLVDANKTAATEKKGLEKQLSDEKAKAKTDLDDANKKAAKEKQALEKQLRVEKARAKTDLDDANKKAAKEKQALEKQLRVEKARAKTDLDNANKKAAKEKQALEKQLRVEKAKAKKDLDDANKEAKAREKALQDGFDKEEARLESDLSYEHEKWTLIRDPDLLVLLPLDEPAKKETVDFSGYRHTITAGSRRKGRGSGAKVEKILDSGALADIDGMQQGLTIAAWAKGSKKAEKLDLITLEFKPGGRGSANKAVTVSMGIEDLGKGQIFLRSSDGSMDYVSREKFIPRGRWTPWVFLLEPYDPDRSTSQPRTSLWLPRFYGPGEFEGTDKTNKWSPIQPIEKAIPLPASIASLRVQIADPGASGGEIRIENVRVYRRPLSKRDVARYTAKRSMNA